MTSDPNDFKGIIERAIASAPRTRLFLEERVDVRMTVASSGLRDIVETRTRGAAIYSPHPVHLTDPDFMEPSRVAMNSPFLWVPLLERPIIEGATRASVGRRNPHWTARLVAFHQQIWVGHLGMGAVRDIRRGCRVELRAQVGTAGTAQAVRELVVGWEESPSFEAEFNRAFDRAEKRLSSCPPPEPGSTAIVLAPGVGGIVAHELIGHALEGDVVARGSTWVSSATLLAARAPLTVIDDPRRGRGAWIIDDEGVVAGETTLIDRGRRVGMLHDLASASALGATSTGHGRRSSYLETVRPRMGCTFFAPGIDAPEDILRSTRAGVFIHRLAGGHTDPVTGRASFIVSDADRIVAGAVAEPLDAFVIELDGYESWESIDRVAYDLAFDTCIGSCVRDGQPIAVSVGAPTIRIGVVRVRS